MMSTRRRVTRIAEITASGSQSSERPDDLSVEAPLQLLTDGAVMAILMRTPGHDLELSAGWLVVESGVRTAGDLVGLRQCRTDGPEGERGIDQVHLSLRPGVSAPQPRAWVTGSSCGVCSADVLDLSVLGRGPAHRAGWTVSVDVLHALPESVRKQQRTFDRTGSLHAAALATATGELLVVREDVGRHNAVDKTTGWALLADRLPATDLLLAVSGRVSFEIVQKAVAAGVAGIVAVSAPSDLAVDLAREHDLVLAGLVRSSTMNLYAGAEYVTR